MGMILELCERAKKASRTMIEITEEQQNDALNRIAHQLIHHKNTILDANNKDIMAAKSAGLDDSMIDRLSLQGDRIEGLAKDLINLVNLKCPLGEVLESNTLENGLSISRVRTPIGVLGVIYEARPNVTVDIAALTIKTGNCAILRGGKETINTNSALMNVISSAIVDAGLPKDTVQWIPSVDRSLVNELLKMYQHIDMIIPRGGADLHRFCREHSMIPVITGGIGICHLFVDETADLKKAAEVIMNAKVQRPTVCNALDTLLVHKNIAHLFIPMVLEIMAPYKLSYKVDSRASALINTSDIVEDAKEGDWDTEWLRLTLGIKVVDSLEEALNHIYTHSSGHSDGIITENKDRSELFVKRVDSAAVYVNASTRFTDGSQFGLGAEVAISTQKLHARGPMGLKELTTYKWIVRGNYHIRK